MDSNKLIRAYSGSEVNCLLLKGALEKAGIEAMIKNEFETSNHAGWITGSPSVLDLYIWQNDLNKAEPVLRSYFDLFSVDND